jgi:hypothetical protein
VTETDAEFLARMQREFDADDAPYDEDWQKLINLAHRGVGAEALRARVVELEEALEQIAGCEPYMVGEWVIILARAALAKTGESA